MKISKKSKTFLLKNKILLITLFFSINISFSQTKDTISHKKNNVSFAEKKSQGEVELSLNPKDPIKAGLYSAVVPGLGQIYNEQYWKFPIVWTGIGLLGYGFMIYNQEYDKTRTEYKRRLNGFDPEYLKNVENDRLLSHLKSMESNRDQFLIYTIVFYIINIVDANVSAHLSEFNVKDIAYIKPKIDPMNYNIGLSINFKF